jgi:nucleotide-binding universal stress UspA family protein
MRHTGIVVGTDGSAPSRIAVRWAAGEARLHGAPLTVLIAYSWAGPPEAHGGAGHPDVVARRFEDMAVAAATEAESMEPGIDVSGTAVLGDPATALLHAGRTASMLVVGNRGRGGLASLLLGSVSQHVVTHATGPVVVVRGRAVHRPGPVVVGVDDAASAQHTLALGFDEAHLRGCGLLAVHCCPMPMPPYGMDMPALPYDPDAVWWDAARDLDAILAPWRDKYPTVPVDALTRPGSPAKNLRTVSGDASLLIVGSRGYGTLVGSLFGSVGRQLLHHADCPILIVHPGEGVR